MPLTQRYRPPIVIGIVTLALASSWLGFSTPTSADGPGATPAYIGAGECKKCHLKVWKSWKETKMAKAFGTLKAGEAKEAKAKFGLDAAKDYTTEDKCLGCHTLGFGQPGGYAKTGDEAARTSREGVQCESCHGPASLYNPYMKEHEKTGYVKEEAAKLGLKMPDEKVCVVCHHGGPDGSPTLAADAKFDFEKMSKDEKAMHVHQAKKEK